MIPNVRSINVKLLMFGLLEIVVLWPVSVQLVYLTVPVMLVLEEQFSLLEFVLPLLLELAMLLKQNVLLVNV